MADPLVEISDVILSRSAGRDRFTVQIDQLVVAKAGRLALLGPSGSGKSTVLEILALASAPTMAGTFLFTPRQERYDVASLWQSKGRDLDRLRARHIGYVPQTGGLLPFLTLRRNIALPGHILGHPPDDRVAELAGRLGIVEQLDRLPDQVSVGQRQRGVIARALLHRPSLLLADEPTSAVDPNMAADVLRLILDEATHSGAAVVVATHDHGAVERVGLPVGSFDVTSDDEGAHARLVMRCG